MEDLIKLLIKFAVPLIALIAYVLSQLAKQQNAGRPAPRVASPEEDDLQAARPERANPQAGLSLEERLQKVRERRRQREEAEKQEKQERADETSAPATWTPPPRPKTVPPPLPSAFQKSAATNTPAVSSREKEAIPYVALVAEPVTKPKPPPVAEFVSPLSAPVLVQIATPPPVLTAASQKTVGSVTQRPVSPAAKKILELLNDRESLRAAFILSEVFDRPVSQRKRKR